MENLHIVRCGRFGNPYPPGKVFRHAGQLLAVVLSNRVNTAGHPGMTVCPYDDCWCIVNVTARLATAEECTAYLEEVEAQRQRMAAHHPAISL
jgi:hypothetical protein